MEPFLKWVGGKRWFVAQHGDMLYRDVARYVEPFLGSGAVFFHINPHNAVLGDLNQELIATYKSLRDQPERVFKHLKSHRRKHCKEHYYTVRAQKPRSPAGEAARLIYLNRTCFNGLYRVNLAGLFNVPQGTNDKVYLPSDNFRSVSDALQGAKFSSRDFSDTIAIAKEGDFLYVDPPYTVQHNNNNFLKYNEHIFSWNDQKRLACCLRDAAKRGVCVLMSNADHACIQDLYRTKTWRHFSVNRFSLLASSSDHRREITELVVSNYLNKRGEQVYPRY